MARRMFNDQIIDSDAFLDMPLTTQALYFHLNMSADDDGMVNNVKKILRVIGANQNDLDLLIAKGFIIVFQSGVITIKHWFIHNTIRKDRKKSTSYIEELSQLEVKKNKSYTLRNNGIKPLSTKWQPNDNQLTTTEQPDVSISKVKLNEVNKEKIYKKEKEQKSIKNFYGSFRNVLLTDDEYEKLNEKVDDRENRIEEMSLGIETHNYKYKNHYAAILNWYRRDLKKQEQEKQEKEKEKKTFVRPAKMG